MIQGRTYNNGSGDAALQGVFLNVPADDWSLLKELIRKFEWQSETREQLMEQFCIDHNRMRYNDAWRSLQIRTLSNTRCCRKRHYAK